MQMLEKIAGFPLNARLKERLELTRRLFDEGSIDLREASRLTGVSQERLAVLFNGQKPEQARKIMVFGGAGFIGSNFVHYLINNYPSYKVIVFDKLTYAGNRKNLKELDGNPNFTFIHGDIANGRQVEEALASHKPDFIINFAAETHVDRSIHESASPFIMTNVYGVYVLLEAARRHKVEKFVHFSTDEVYGELDLDDEDVFTEEHPFQPNVPYAASKAGGDLMCRAYWESFRTPVVVTHCSNNYGPFQYPEKLIPFFTLRAIENKPLPLYGDGRNVRDWLFVDDNCRAVDTILHYGQPGQTYNIAGKQELPNIEVARTILKLLGRSESLIKFVEDRPGHDRRYALDITKIKKDLNWTPAKDFTQGLPSTIEWYLKNNDWIEGVRRRNGQFNPHIKV